MFKHYLYIPSGAQTRLNDFEDITQSAYQRFQLHSDSLVIDIGSNDGSLLSCFKAHGVKVLGVDPAQNLKEVAESKGVPTETAFFTREVAQRLVQKYQKAAIVTTTNVFAHVENIIEFMLAIHDVLDTDGIYISQFPYLADLLCYGQFDTIYHEHMSYYSLKPLQYLAQLTGFEIIDVQPNDLDGGAIRVFWKKKESQRWQKNEENIAGFLEREEQDGLYSFDTYEDFSERISLLKVELLTLLKQLKKEDKRIVGYGAPAKGTILLNYFGIDHTLLDYVVDSTRYKQGRFIPGVQLEIFPEQKIYEDKPDYLLVLAWNFAKEIIEKNDSFKTIGQFILPSPAIEIV
jgi:SAM-dependent methyltransferase